MAARWTRFAWLGLLGLALGASLVWREAHVHHRPLHADEAVQAWQTWHLLQGEGYCYDPADRHGPTLYFGAATLHRLTGGEAATFDDQAARRFSLVMGALTLLLLGWGPRMLGAPAWVGPIAVALLAFETLSTLYHTYFVQEATLALLVWAFLGLLLCPRHRAVVIALGLVAGLAQATKEITPLYLLLAWAAVRLAHRPETRMSGRDWAWALAAFSVPFVLLYTSFGANGEGLGDAFRTYVLQATRVAEPVHHQPWWHLFVLLGIVPTGGPSWGQYPLLALGAAGLGLGLRRSAVPLHRASALFTAALLGLHALVPYKAPWLLLTPVLGLGLLGAFAVHRLFVIPRLGPMLAVAAVGVAAAQCLHVGRLALDRYPGDPRNPYFYQQAPRPFMRLVDEIERSARVAPAALKIAVVSAEQAWPLPWYLRNFTQVGYFSALPPSPEAWDIVVWDSQLGSFFEHVSGEPWQASYFGFRPGAVLEVSTQRELWEAVHFPTVP